MTEILKVVAVASVVSLSSAQADEEALRRIGEIRFAVDQRIAFTERRHSPLLRRPIVQHGLVWTDSMGDVVMQIQTPRLEERRIEKDRLVLRRSNRRDSGSPDEALKSATPRYRKLDPSRPMHLALWAAAQVIAGDTAALQSHFAVVPRPDESLGAEAPSSGWGVELIPRDGKARSVLPAIRLYGRATQLQYVVIDRGKGRRYDLSFAHEQEDVHGAARSSR